MSYNEENRDAAKVKALHAAKDAVNEVSSGNGEIRQDLQALKSDAIVLARDIRDAGTDKTRDATVYLQDRAEALKEAGVTALKSAEVRIKQKPGQSVVIAFLAGTVASYLLSRKS